MTDRIKIAIDAMGGDHAPSIVIEGLSLSAPNYPDAVFQIYGVESAIKEALKPYPKLADCVEIYHTDDVVAADDKPSQALRRGRSSSMGLAINAVKEGTADVAVSAGNTGALMALAKFTLRMMPEIDRPALISLMPSHRGEVCMLDLGANVECDANNLVQFSVMGAAYVRALRNNPRPSVGLLNVGTEELKGKGPLRVAADILKHSDLEHLEYKGFVEGNSMGMGDVDVVVTDGFTGNIALKTIEGTARMMGGFVKSAFKSSLFSKIGYLFAKSGFQTLAHKMDPNTHNGGVLLGLNGLVVKSHGGANGYGFACAINVAYEMVSKDLNKLIADDLSNVQIPDTGLLDADAEE